jgi:DNA-binding SARP family transcriptional activator
VNAEIPQDLGSAVRLELLGAPRLVGAGVVLSLDRKLAGVLTYLALEGATPRAVLSELIWPHAPRDRARQSLRQALLRLHGFSGILVSSDPLRFSAKLSVDVLEERTALAKGELDAEWQARGLLEGLEFDDALEFSEWLRVERERLSDRRGAALALEAERFERAGLPLEALRVLMQRLAMDGVSEPAYRQVMRLHASLGDRAAALRCYHELSAHLERELGVLPLPETRALAAEITERIQVAPPPADELALSVRLTRAMKLLQDGNRLEARGLAQSVLESAPTDPQAQRAHLIVASAMLLEGTLTEAVAHLEAAAVSREPDVRLRALMNLGNVAGWLHGPEAGLPLFQQALRIAETSGQAAMVAALHNNIAAGYTRLGRLESAQYHLERALERGANAADGRACIQMRANLAQLCLMRGQLSRSLQLSAEACAQAHTLGGLPQTASAELIRGLALWRVGDAAATTHLKHALAVHMELNDPLKRVTLEFNLATLKLEVDASAFPLALAALEGLNITKDDALIALCTLELALLCDDRSQQLELANCALHRNATPQTRLLHAIVHADEGAIEAALQSNLHETGLAYAALHTLLKRTAPLRAEDALARWRAQFALETGDLTPAHRAGRLRYYARRVPDFEIRVVSPGELTLA